VRHSGGLYFPRRSSALPITAFDEKGEKVIDVWLTSRTQPDLKRHANID